jgi:hypothetical protein
MTVKLNLTINEDVVAQSKALASKRKTSLSKIVEELLKKENSKRQKSENGLMKFAGILNGKLSDESTEEMLTQKRKDYGY